MREREKERERERQGKREKRRHKYKWTNAAMISCRPRKEAQAFTRLWRKFERKGSVLDSEVVCIFCPPHIREALTPAEMEEKSCDTGENSNERL